jgi:hypothetical protein
VDPFRLKLSVVHPDGFWEQLGPDEPDGRDVLQSPSFGTVAPGGYGEFSATLARDIADSRLSRLDRFDELRLTGSGDRTAWAGYNIAVPANKGDDVATVGITGTGWSNALSDDEALIVIFDTRDLGAWGEAPLLRRIALAGAVTTDFVASADGHAITFDSQTKKDIAAGSYAELWATAPGGSKFGAIAYHLDVANDTDITIAIGATDNEDGTGGEIYSTSSAAGVQIVSLTTARKYISIGVIANVDIASKPDPLSAIFSNVTLYGDSGISTAAIAGDAPGVLASDAIAWALNQAFPGWSQQITDSAFAIPELGFGDGASVQNILEAANAYEGYDYFVWEGPSFVYAPVGSTGRVWRVNTNDGAKLTEQGEQAEDTWTRIVGFFTEPTGEIRTVGPPSLASRVDFTDSRLEITDSSNPAVRANRPRTKNLPITFPTTADGAKQISAGWLADMATVEEQGSVSVQGWAQDRSTGVWAPCYMIKAGDRIVIENVSPRERYVVSTSYDGESRALAANLDSPPHLVEDYIARIEARTRT